MVAAKEKELADYPETADWVIEGAKEIDLDEVSKAYSEKGLNARGC